MPVDDEYVNGQVWRCYDSDGRLDVVLTDPGGPKMIHRNKGNGEFEISPLSSVATLSDQLSIGAVFADCDKNGCDDLLSRSHEEGYRHYHNDKSGRSEN